jgi:S1-C subfamily serine protease
MSADLISLSQSLASTVERLAPSLVRVEARRRHGATGLLWSADGHILTSHHAIEHEGSITVGFADGRTQSAELVGRDPSTDLALLKTEGTGLTPLAPATLEGVKVGHLVLALGRPGRTARATLGIVSALGEGWRTYAGGRIDRYLETDADLPPGFSGGALVDTQGRLLGLLTTALSRNAAVVLPGETLTRVAQALQQHGGIRRGYLGVSAHPVRLPKPVAERAGTEAGLMLLSIEPDGPADKAGLHMGDILVSLGGQPLHSLEDLLGYLGDEKVGTEIAAKVLRANEAARELPITIGKRP